MLYYDTAYFKARVVAVALEGLGPGAPKPSYVKASARTRTWSKFDYFQIHFHKIF